MVTGYQLAEKGIQLANTRPSIKYRDVDCQAFMELIFRECGQKIDYAGSNDMYRNACWWVGTLEEAKRDGFLVPGAALFIVEHDGGEPDRYKADGKGNSSHVGMYVGENALVDVDKNGKERVCNVVHSSASMGRVAGSTLKNAWTHVGMWNDVNFSGMPTGEAIGDDNMGESSGMIEAMMMYVNTENGEPVNFREKPNVKATRVPRVPEIPNGAIVVANFTSGEWTNVTYSGYTGYVMNEFLKEGAGAETVTEVVGEAVTSTPSGSDETLGDINDKAKLYRVYVDFYNRKDALAFQKAMQGCQVGSVKK